MFALLHNMYKFVRSKAERRVCLIVLGIDNAGKTTLLNVLQGQMDVEATPTFGFNAVHTSSAAIGIRGAGPTGWRCSLQLFDLGGGKNIRRVWKSYLAEVHGVVYVVDAADAARMAECKATLQDVAGDASIQGKPILVLANKQDLPGAAPAADVAQQLGLAELLRTSYHVCACSARAGGGGGGGQQGRAAPVDPRIRDGLAWLLQAVRQGFPQLDARVQRDTAVAKEEEARRKRERDKRARQAREERARLAAEKEQQAQAQAQQQPQQHIELTPPPEPPAQPPPHVQQAQETATEPFQAALPAAQAKPGQHVIDVLSITSVDGTQDGDALSPGTSPGPQEGGGLPLESPPLPTGLPTALPQLPSPSVITSILAESGGRPGSSQGRPASRQRQAASTPAGAAPAGGPPGRGASASLLVKQLSNRVVPVVA